jgi:predicted nucleic acid-binding Zn ribbon protein
VNTRTTPCIAWDEEGRHCLAGLLLGVACCPDGDCALCARDRARMRHVGFSETEVARRFARGRARLVHFCPVCGLPPPPPLRVLPPLPRLERPGRPCGGRHDCRVCGRALPRGRRTYCSDTCWREYVRRTEMVGQDIFSPAPPPVYRAHFG